jgi:hypothetical protein
MCEQYPKSCAFSFLEDLKIEFLKEFQNLEEIQKFYSYEIDVKFKTKLKDLLNFYSFNPKFNKQGKMINENEITKDVKFENAGID